jgi:hypothetical protein
VTDEESGISFCINDAVDRRYWEEAEVAPAAKANAESREKENF